MRIGGNTVTDLQARGAGFAINKNLRCLCHDTLSSRAFSSQVTSLGDSENANK
jgi:hypothetical protein